jgi:hypothetical protein
LLEIFSCVEEKSFVLLTPHSFAIVLSNSFVLFLLWLPMPTLILPQPQGGDPTAVDSSAATPSFQMKGVMPSQQAAEVTPPEGGDEPHKQVRFGAAAAVDAVERTETRSRGAVSRRGRYVSPGRRALDLGSTSPVNDAVTGKQPQEVLSYQTFRSPSRSKEQDVPSLCSTGSEVGGDQSKQAPAQHIQVSASEATTSPLAAPDVVGGKKPVTRQATKVRIVL